jgi:hypothetical protein
MYYKNLFMKIFNNKLKKFSSYTFHKYDKDELTYKRIPKIKILTINLAMLTLMFFIGFVSGFNSGIKTESEKETEGYIMSTREDFYPTENKAWVDSTFKDYEFRATLYLERPMCTGTPLTGEMLSFCARNAYDSTGVLVPVELALAQVQWESSFGREGRSPVKNPYNVGENDSGTVKWYDSTVDGVQAYFYLMATKYLKCKTVEQLLFNFTNCGGKRYASGEYELHVGPTYYRIKRWLDKNIRI